MVTGYPEGVRSKTKRRWADARQYLHSHRRSAARWAWSIGRSAADTTRGVFCAMTVSLALAAASPVGLRRRCWLSWSAPAHGSGWERRRRRSLRAVQTPPPAVLPSSSHARGVATGAPSRARKEYGVMAVAPRPLRKWSMNTLPGRFAFDMVATYFPG